MNWLSIVQGTALPERLSALTGFTATHRISGPASNGSLSWNAVSHSGINKHEFEKCSDVSCSSSPGMWIVSVFQKAPYPVHRIRLATIGSGPKRNQDTDGPWTSAKGATQNGRGPGAWPSPCQGAGPPVLHPVASRSSPVGGFGASNTAASAIRRTCNCCVGPAPVYPVKGVRGMEYSRSSLPL